MEKVSNNGNDPRFRMDYRYAGDGTTGAPGWDYPFNYGQTTWMQEQFPGYSNTKHPGEWDIFPYQCLQCDDEHYCDDDGDCWEVQGDCWISGPVVEAEEAWCFCDEVSTTWLADGTTRESCAAWHCEEGGDQSGRKAAEEEHYVAHDKNHLGAVMTWSGRTDSVEEFERSECTCEMSSPRMFCMSWYCFEKGLHYVYPYPFSVLAHICCTPLMMAVVLAGWISCDEKDLLETDLGKCVCLILIPHSSSSSSSSAAATS